MGPTGCNLAGHSAEALSIHFTFWDFDLTDKTCEQKRSVSERRLLNVIKCYLLLSLYVYVRSLINFMGMNHSTLTV